MIIAIKVIASEINMLKTTKYLLKINIHNVKWKLHKQMNIDETKAQKN